MHAPEGIKSQRVCELLSYRNAWVGYTRGGEKETKRSDTTVFLIVQQQGKIQNPSGSYTNITPRDIWLLKRITIVKWIRQFERFCLASVLKEQTKEYEVNSLLCAMGDAADDILGVLPLTNENKKKYSEVKAAFEQHCLGKQHTTQHNFWKSTV